MKPEWKAFLSDYGAEFSDQRVESFGNPERERQVVTTGEVICDLSHSGLIGAYGGEAQQFLQGQLTNDVAAVDSNHSQLSAYCTPKGRMLATFRLFWRKDTYYMRMPREVLEPTLQRLQMFVLMSRVTLEDASDALVRFGLSGPGAEQELREAVGGVPAAADEAYTTSECTVIRAQGPHPRFELYGELDPMRRLWERLNVRAAPVGAFGWSLLDILAGVPTVYTQTREAFVPQMANLDRLGGVSFNKGCYPGQEVVARMHYLGRLKRRTYRAHAGPATLPAPGDPVAGGPSGEAVGTVVAAEWHPDGGAELLAVLQIDAATGGDLRIGEDEAPLELQPLPYELDDPDHGEQPQ